MIGSYIRQTTLLYIWRIAVFISHVVVDVYSWVVSMTLITPLIACPAFPRTVHKSPLCVIVAYSIFVAIIVGIEPALYTSIYCSFRTDNSDASTSSTPDRLIFCVRSLLVTITVHDSRATWLKPKCAQDARLARIGCLLTSSASSPKRAAII